MNGEQCLKWEPVTGVDRACADISFFYDAPHVVVVRVQYSRAMGDHEFDLQLTFRGAIAVRWEEESFGLNPLPEDLPKTSDGQWTFPLLRIAGSKWLREHTDRHPVAAASRQHYAMVSMIDLLQVLAMPDPKAEWVRAEHAA